jgi:two-component sensor histidine kinase
LSDKIDAVLEDREQNLWVATPSGIERFRDPRTIQLSKLNGLSSDVITVVLPSHDGSVWAGTAEGIDHIAANGIVLSRENKSQAVLCQALFEDESRRLWVASLERFGYLAEGHFTEVRTSQQKSLHKVYLIAHSPGGGVWLLDETRGILKVHDGVVEPADLPGGPIHDAYQLYFDRSGSLWIGHYQGGVTLFQGAAVRAFGAKDGLPQGAVQAITQDRSGSIWVGTPAGLARYRNSRWTAWTARQGVPSGGILAILEDDYRNLWLFTPSGVSRISLATLDQSRDGVPSALDFTSYGQEDGIRLAQVTANPRAAKSLDGKLWFPTAGGIAVIDPAQVRRNEQPPPVVVEEIAVDGAHVDRYAPHLSFLGRHVHLTYNGLSFIAPENLRFKYQLEGLDKKMSDPVTQRDADYANLLPRHYRFHVIAANSDGVWNQSGALLDFDVEPHFWETTLFKLLCLGVAGLIVWGGVQLRIRIVLGRYQAMVNERTRLTRELHDYLLQGFVAVVYQLEAVARQFTTAPEPAMQRLERAIEQADRAVSDARRTMMAMRLPALEKETLPEAFSTVGRQLVDGTNIAFDLDVTGRVRQLPYEEQAAVFLIGREAMSNAVNHANPSRIEMLLEYTPKQLRMSVKDNGSGFDLETGSGKSGHWGLSGMRERAQQIGAVCTLSSAPGKGTRVELVVSRKGKAVDLPRDEDDTNSIGSSL